MTTTVLAGASAMLVVVAAVGTPAAAFRTGFGNAEALLLINTGLLAASMALVAGSLAVYEPGTQELVIPESELSRLRDR